MTEVCAFCACFNRPREDYSFEGWGGDKQMSVIEATFPSSDNQTRVAFQENRSLVWTESDQLHVFNNDLGSMVDYNLQEGGGTASGTFTASPSAGFTPGYVIYSENTPAISENVLTLDLPTTFAHSTSKHPLPMQGTIAEGKVSLKHLTGYLKVTYKDVPADATKLKVTADKVVAGQFKATLTDSEPTLVAADGNTAEANKSFDFTFTNASVSDMTFYIPLPAATYGSIKVALMKGESELTAITFLNKTVARKMVYSTTLTYTESGVIIPTESNATTEDGLAEDINAALTAAAANSTVVVDVNNAIVAASDKAVSISVAANKHLEINFKTVPTTTAEAALDIKDSSSPSVGESVNNVKIVMPGNSTIANMNVDMPVSHVTLESSDGNEVTYTKLTTKTGTTSLVVAEKVKVSAVKIEGGKVSVEGGDVTLDASNTAGTVEVSEVGCPI